MNKKTKMILLALGLYLISTGGSFAAFANLGTIDKITSPKEVVDDQAGEDIGARSFSGPRDQACPINGAMYTREQREIWEQRRPLMVMIENHKDSRPQSGLSRADVIYEAVAEGGITRFMAVYYCQATEPYETKYDLGPVRSARTYFLDLASEYSDYPLYVHVGGAHCSEEGGYCTTDKRAQALEQISAYGWLDPDHRSDMNQFALDYSQCRREPERTGESRATEHTMYCDTTALWQKAQSRGLAAKGDYGGSWDDNFVSWSFKDEAEPQERGSVNQISFDFWEGYSDYSVEWDYDSATNSYKRKNGGQPHVGFVTGEQLSAKVVIAQFVAEIGPVDKHKHMLYDLIGSGKALIFQDGQVINARWEKDEREARTIFTDVAGKEIKFNRGLIFLEILPKTNQVNYNEAD